MRYIVGYDAKNKGRDAIALAATLARGQDAQLEIVLVAPKDIDRIGPHSPGGLGYQKLLTDEAQERLDHAAQLVPSDVTARTHLRFAESSAHGLIEAAEELEADLIVIGTARGGIIGRFTVGSVAGALLHAAETPVALVPNGYQLQDGISRITCATGQRPGAKALLDVAVDTAAARDIDLRIMSLLALDDADPDDPWAHPGNTHSDHVQRAEQHAGELAEAAAAALPRGRNEVSVVVAEGDSVEQAIAATDFQRSELVLVGSSRLATGRRVFLGPAAARILRALPVPMVVVPREYRAGIH